MTNRVILLVLLSLLVVACSGSGEEIPVATVFVPTAEPTPSPTVTSVRTPTFSPEALRDYAAFCDGQLRQAFLGIEGSWQLSEVWDYALQQVSDCSPPYWLPRVGPDDGRDLQWVAGVGVSEDLRFRSGRAVDGTIRVSFADGFPAGDGYHHWYFDSHTRRWYSGDYVKGEAEAVPVLAELDGAVLSSMASDCWLGLQEELQRSISLGRSVGRQVAMAAVSSVQRSTWRCSHEIWSALVVDGGQVSSYCGTELPVGIQAGPGLAGDGSFRVDFRDQAGGTRSLVYLAGGVSSGGASGGGFLSC